MQRKKKLCSLLVLFAVLLFWQGWGMRTVSAQTEEAPRASGGEELAAAVTDSFTDSHGVTYKWKGFEDGTAEVYEFTVGADVVEIVLDIPGEIEGYTVTRLTGKLEDTEIKTVTIPESIVQFGEDTFRRSTIETLNYNAVDAFPISEFYFTPFGYAVIKHLNLGANVNKIESYLFYQTVIKQSEVVLNVPYIADSAFTGATLEALRLTNDIEYLGQTAFDDTEIKYVYYDILEVEINAKSLTEGPFRHAVIGGIEFCQELTEIPDYLFCGARFEISELTIDKEWIGDYAFYSVWNTEILSTGYDRADRLTLTENVKYVGKCAFGSCYIKEAAIMSDLELMAESTTEGPFYMAHIYGIKLGEAVNILPDYLFCNAAFHMEKLTVDKPHIGRACFYNVWDKYTDDIVPAELTVTENVEYIGGSAFANNMLSKLIYNADAANDSQSMTDGAFSSCELAGITLGSHVKGIPAFFFSNTKFLQDIDLTIEGPIGQYAFNAASSSYGGFGYLVLGENVTSIGKAAFNNREIGSLSYNAVRAVVDIKNTGDAPFCAITIGSLAIGDKVELLDKSLMCGVNLAQEKLVIPDSVQEIGNYFFYNIFLNKSGVQIGTLRIGSGLKMLYVNSFRSIQFTDIYVDAVEAGEDYDSKTAVGYTGNLPKSENLYIHHDSDFYNYFSPTAGEIHLHCDSHM